MYGIPKCLGVVDGTCVPISKPRRKEVDDSNLHLFQNRHGQKSLNLIMIADFNQIYRYFDVYRAGRSDDSHCFQTSTALEDMEKGLGFGGSYFCDAAFKNSPFLMTNFREREMAEHTEAKLRYNSDFKALRASTIESSFGILKGKFAILKNLLKTSLEAQQENCVSCVVTQLSKNVQRLNDK